MAETVASRALERAPAMVAAGLEVLTGVGLVAAPSLLARLLFGAEMGGTGDLVGRIAGLVMICLAAGLWPRGAERRPETLSALAALSLAAALYLLVVGLGGTNVGVLLWPAFAAHAVLAALLVRVWLVRRGADANTRA